MRSPGRLRDHDGQKMHRLAADVYKRQPEAQPAMKPPVFHPFTMRTGAQAPASGGSALRRLAKKARDLVGVDDEDHRPTIHDLQSTVDVTQAFHEPVYPRPRDQQGGEK